jgi:hypothetical protein
MLLLLVGKSMDVLDRFSLPKAALMAAIHIASQYAITYNNNDFYVPLLSK